jgi:hypothetical protein
VQSQWKTWCSSIPPPQTVLRDAKGHGAIDRRYRVHHHSWAPAARTKLACTFTVVGGPGSVLPYMTICLAKTLPFCTILWHSSKKMSNAFLLSSIFLLPWRWRRKFPPKRRFLQDPHATISQKTAFIIVTAVKTSNPTTKWYYIIIWAVAITVAQIKPLNINPRVNRAI